jgi:hypothetical protein
MERTLNLLREAARELLRTGGPLTVTTVAELAGVSRATAGRSFPARHAAMLRATVSLTDDPLEDIDWALHPAASSREVESRAADRRSHWLPPRDRRLDENMREALPVRCLARARGVRAGQGAARRRGFCPAQRSGQGKLGGRDRRRSGDLALFRRALCQLSYPTAGDRLTAAEDCLGGGPCART